MKPVLGVIGAPGHLADTFITAANHKGFIVTSARQADIVYVAPDRPDRDPQHFVDYALSEMRNDAILVIHCQVVPGFTRKIDWPKQQLYYHVETLKVSENTMDRALNPERIIIGTDGWKLPPSLDEFLISFHCPILRMSYESAELAKIAINLYLAAQVCTTNTLSEVAENVGANWDDIIPALQTDKRIGKDAYIKPGTGVGKHLMRDLETLRNLKYVNTDVLKAFIEHSNYRGKSG